MRKIDEVIAKYVPPICQGSHYEEMMKEYAEWYAKECLKIAADKAMVIKTFYSADSPQIWDMAFEESSYVHVHKDSILNIQLPDHDNSR